MKKETYICNGLRFKTYEAVEKYCEENNYKITNTETIRKNVYLIYVLSNDHANMIKS